MDNISTIFSILEQSGITPTRYDANFIYIQDPSCLNNFLTNPIWNNMSILDIGWTIIVCFTTIIILGWAIAYLRGLNNNIFDNFRNLALILTIIISIQPMVNVIYGEDLSSLSCKEIPVSKEVIEQLSNRIEPIEMITIVEDSGPLFEETGTAEAYTDNLSLSYSTQRTSTATYSSSASSSSSKPSNSIIYTNSQGVTIRHTGGSLAWRNNNPGNIVMGDFARSHGAKIGNGRFAVFPDAQTGKRAIVSLLKSKNYINLTIYKAIHRWCPFGDGNNNPNTYVNKVKQLTHLDPYKKVNELTMTELQKMADAIQTVEGWKVGKEEILK